MLTTKNTLQGKFRSEKFTSTMSLKTELIEKIYICTLYGYMPDVKLSNFQACIKYTRLFANLTYKYTVHLFMWVHFHQL